MFKKLCATFCTLALIVGIGATVPVNAQGTAPNAAKGKMAGRPRDAKGRFVKTDKSKGKMSMTGKKGGVAGGKMVGRPRDAKGRFVKMDKSKGKMPMMGKKGGMAGGKMGAGKMAGRPRDAKGRFIKTDKSKGAPKGKM